MTRPLRPVGAALVAVVALLGSLLVSQGTAHAAGPVVAVTSPAATDPVKGPWQLSADLSTDAGDAFTSAVLQLDGTPLPVTDTCSGSDQPCTLSIQHDFTGDSGTHTVTILATTGLVTTPVSDTVTFTVTSPGPFASFSSPAAGSTRKGRFDVVLSGQTDASQTDEFVQTLELLRGPTLGSAVLVSNKPCGGTARTCSSTVAFDATTLPDGPLTFWARVTATSTRQASSSVVVSINNPTPAVTISAPTGGEVFGNVQVSVSATTDASLSDFPSSIAVTLDAGTPAEVLLGTVPCPGDPDHSCTGQVSWDASAFPGAHTFDARLTTTRGAFADASTRTVTAVSPLPTVVITDPAGGATVSGTVVVTATVSTDPRLTEVPTQVQLLVDGTVVDTQPCIGGTHDCPITLTWDATGVTGDHVLTTVVSTSLTRTAVSDPVSVSVTTPPFQVAIGSPAASAVVAGTGATSTSSGVVTVSVTASTDASQNEFPSTIELLVDGVTVGSAGCGDGLRHDCAVDIKWDARRSAGLHRLAARVITTRAREATSASRSVFARSGSRVAFFGSPIDAYGGTLTVRGRVASTTSGLPLVGVAVRVVLVPAVGKARSVVVRTGVGGVFSLRTRYYSNTKITAIVGSSWLVRGSGGLLQRVRAPMVCSTSSSRYIRGATGRGVCVVRNLPVGTVVRLRYSFQGRWFTLASGRSKSSSVLFTFRFVTRGKYVLQVTVGSSRVYVATSGRLLPVTFR